jgi:elongation factor G
MALLPKIVQVAIQATSACDYALLRQAVDRAVDRDTLASASHDHQDFHTILRSVNLKHLDVLIDGLMLEIGQKIQIGAPQVEYRETFARSVVIDYSHRKQLGIAGQFARVMLKIEPGGPGQGVNFINSSPAASIPLKYASSIEKGIREAAATGSLIGFPMVDFTATLIDGAYHDTDSSAQAFELAARAAMRDAAEKAGINLFEPVMKIAVITAGRWLDEIKSELKRRRATIEQTRHGVEGLVIATAPMAEIFSFEKYLTTLAGGAAAAAMIWDHYAQVPPEIFDPDDTFPSAAALRA